MSKPAKRAGEEPPLSLPKKRFRRSCAGSFSGQRLTQSNKSKVEFVASSLQRILLCESYFYKLLAVYPVVLLNIIITGVHFS